MSVGVFEAEGLRFELDDGFTPVRFGEPTLLSEEPLDALDTLGPKAQLPSWLLARLTRLFGQPLFSPEVVEVCEDGVFVVDLLAALPDGRVLAKLQLQAGDGEAGLLSMHSKPEHSRRAVDALVKALLADPEALAVCEVQIASSPKAKPSLLWLLMGITFTSSWYADCSGLVSERRR